MQPADITPLPTAFRRIGWSNLFAQFSEQIALAAAPLAAVLLLAAGPAETGWLQTAQTLPFLLLSIPAGLMVDRASRRRLMVGTEALRAVSLLAIATEMLRSLASWAMARTPLTRRTAFSASTFSA